MKNLYLIGGTMGVGKTTVCQQLKKDLPNSVFLDGDWCWDADPFQVNEETKTMVIDNICYLLHNFLGCSASDNVIFCWVMHQKEIIESIISKLIISNCNIYPISFVCTPNVLKERLYKDIADGKRSPEVVEKSLTYLSMYTLLQTKCIDTSYFSVKQIADLIAHL